MAGRHPYMKLLDDAAGRRLAKRGDDCVQQGGKPSNDEPAREAECDAQMLEIGFIDLCRVVLKQRGECSGQLGHAASPLSFVKVILLEVKNCPKDDCRVIINWDKVPTWR